MLSEQAVLERNLQLFPRYKAVSSVLPWLPVFFLYFIERVPLGEAVLLAAQVLLAAGIAFQSGSDRALLYDSLHWWLWRSV